jgi:hypothetical protein
MRNINFAREITLIFSVLLLSATESASQQKPSQEVIPSTPCPTIRVEDNAISTTIYEFKAMVVGGTNYSPITYSWTSNGEIISGQGTPHITVKSHPGLRATVAVGGLHPACSSVASASAEVKDVATSAKLYDRYSRLPFDFNEPETPSNKDATATADDDEWPPMNYLRSDYKSVAVVAHIVIREAEITSRIVGYENWRILCEVIEPFKGKFKKGDTFEYLHGAEAGFKKEYFTGEKIVFLLREYDKTKKDYKYSVLENSTLPAAPATLKKLRIIKSSSARSRTGGKG